MNKYAVYIEVVGDTSSKKLKVGVSAKTRQEAINNVLDNINIIACKPIGEEIKFEDNKQDVDVENLKNMLGIW